MHEKMNALRKLFLFALLLLVVGLLVRYKHKLVTPFQNSSATNSSNKIQSTSIKQEKWKKMEEDANRWADALGLGIDPGIKKTVIVLNLLGFKTDQSCEGHINWGRMYPWVSIMYSDPHIDALKKEAKIFWNQYLNIDDDMKKKYPNLSLREALNKEENKEINKQLDEIFKEYNLINSQIFKLSKLKIMPLNDLIADFYKTHPIHLDTLLCLHEFMTDGFELYSLGAIWQIARDETEKQRRLEEYQREMESFTDFLTDYYFTH